MTDALKPNLAEIKFFAAVILLVAAFLAGHHVGELRATAKLAKAKQTTAEQTTKAVETARTVEHNQADAFAAIDIKFQGDMRYAQALSASTVAGLRDGSIRLRDTWRCPAPTRVPTPAASAGSDSAADRLREESAGRIVQYVAQLQAERDAALDKLAAERK